MSKKLTEIVDWVVDKLNTSPPETWVGHKVGTDPTFYLKAEPAIDPLVMFQSERKGLFVLPFVREYDITASQGRQKLIKLIKKPSVIVAMAVPFETKDKVNQKDAALWGETKLILNLREEIDDYLCGLDWEGLSIKTMDASPQQDIPLEARWFCAATEFQLEMAQCV